MIDLTGIAQAVIAGVFTILAVVIPMIIQSHMKDQKDAATLSNAVVNAVGAIKDATMKGKAPPIIPGVTPDLAAGVQYVRTHAGDEAERLNQTPELIADKIRAKQGLQALIKDAAPVVNVVASAEAAPAATTMPRPLFSKS